MKIVEPYIPSVTSNQIPENILFKLASDEHVYQIVMLMHERNPDDFIESLKAKTLKEITFNRDDPSYWH
jgi:hypothetical protein